MNSAGGRWGPEGAEPVGGRVARLSRVPSAYVPVIFSLAACGLVAVHVALVGPARETDEGTAAHLWQLLMLGQVPFLLTFAVKWLPQAPRAALVIIALQLVAAAMALAPVFFLGL